MDFDEISLPPLLNAICSPEPFQSAIKQVRARQAGAGDLFWADDTYTAKVAIVLEPEVAHHRVLEMLPLAQVALSDCLAVLLPPQVAVEFRDIGKLVVNGGVVGDIQAAVSATSAESEIPDWLVLAASVGLRRRSNEDEPGQQPDITTLDEEGWEETNLGQFIETFARHLLSWTVAWSDDGFDNVARAWKFKSEDKADPDLAKFKQALHVFESTL